MTIATSENAAVVDPLVQPPEVSLKRKASTVCADADADVEKVTQTELTVSCDEVKRNKLADDDATPVGECAASAAEELYADDADASIYPDTEEFYAWHVSGSEAGAFLACHRVQSMDAALPACKKLVEIGVTSVYDPADEENNEEAKGNSSKESLLSSKDEEEIKEGAEGTCDEQTRSEKELDEKPEDDDVEDMKEAVNYAIEDSYCIVLEDSSYDVDACALRKMVDKCADNKKWMKLRVARENEAGAVPITVSVFDARKGLVIPKIGCWKWLAEACEVEDAVDAGLKMVMEKFC